jgi:hypothetical protein
MWCFQPAFWKPWTGTRKHWSSGTSRQSGCPESAPQSSFTTPQSDSEPSCGYRRLASSAGICDSSGPSFSSDRQADEIEGKIRAVAGLGPRGDVDSFLVVPVHQGNENTPETFNRAPDSANDVTGKKDGLKFPAVAPDVKHPPSQQLYKAMALETDPSYSKLHPFEKDFCGRFRVWPGDYLQHRNTMLRAAGQQKSFTSVRAVRLLKIDVNKTRAMYRLWVFFSVPFLRSLTRFTQLCWNGMDLSLNEGWMDFLDLDVEESMSFRITIQLNDVFLASSRFQSGSPLQPRNTEDDKVFVRRLMKAEPPMRCISPNLFSGMRELARSDGIDVDGRPHFIFDFVTNEPFGMLTFFFEGPADIEHRTCMARAGENLWDVTDWVCGTGLEKVETFPELDEEEDAMTLKHRRDGSVFTRSRFPFVPVTQGPFWVRIHARKDWRLYAGLGALALIPVALAAWAVFRKKPPKDKDQNQ